MGFFVEASFSAALFLVLLAIGLLLAPGSADAQEPKYEIGQIVITGNQFFDRGTLLGILTSRETPGALSQFFNKISGDRLGSKPEYFQPENLPTDERLITDLYAERGFLHTKVVSGSTLDSARHSAVVTFTIEEGGRSVIDSLSLRGIEKVGNGMKERILNALALKSGQPYEPARVADGLKKVLDLLRNNGYRDARYIYDSSGAYEVLSTHRISLGLYFQTGRQYYFGPVTVHVDPAREDIGPDLAIRQLDFTRGDVYSTEKKLSSERGLNRLGLFDAARIEESRAWDSTRSNAIPMDIFLKPKIRNELSPEVIVSNENNELNLGLGVGYTNRNFFGDGRTFSTNFQGSTQSLTKIVGGKSFRDPDVVGALDFQTQILQPYLFEKTLTGFLSSDFGIDKQKAYVLYFVRNKIGLNKQFATYTYGSLEWTLERDQPDFLVDTVGQPDVAATLREQDKAQFNSILTLTLQRDKTNDPFSPTDGFFHSISIEESGILPRLLQGSHLDVPYTQYYKVTLFGRWYDDLSSSRFDILAMKLKTGYQDKYGDSRDRDVSIPLDRRFFSGGSGSLRGWRARELGAMPDPLLPFGGNFLLEGSMELRVNHFRDLGKWGFIKFENIWMVYFLDVGNTWAEISDFRARDIAMAAGVGFRYETFFGPFRIDYGVKVYDPKAPPTHATIFQKQLVQETLGSGVLHFGIGHAF
ncbi:MAG TPA: BamA/TamA family outer membrane protein [Bacteroidota bacterium]|nr:BamA/TamA family outer membrane protein [Bacteroidota bacterium]